MRRYRARKRAVGLKQVRHWAPAEPVDVSVFSEHRLLDARSLVMHCKIAQKISRNPMLLDKAHENLSRWRQEHADLPPRYLREWEDILDNPWPVVAAFITSFSERAIRLRQSSPFAGVLTGEERKRIYEAFRA